MIQFLKGIQDKNSVAYFWLTTDWFEEPFLSDQKTFGRYRNG